MEDTEIVNMYWARNSNAIQETETNMAVIAGR